MSDKDFMVGDGSTKQHWEDMGDGTNAPTVWAVDGALADDGTALDLSNLAQTLAYNADGTLNYIQVTKGGNNYRQTYAYTSAMLTGISKWVKQ